MNKGFTLFIAIIVMGTLLLITAGITSLAVKQSFISSSGRESQAAFYAADTGMDCALYWDVNNSGGNDSAFATSTTSTINCNNTSIPGMGGLNDGRTTFQSSTSTFSFVLSPNPYCATVYVGKAYVGGILKTTIESKGYNTCDTSNPRRVERAVRATY